jgi:hypothetical protein
MLSAVDARLRSMFFETNATIPMIAKQILLQKTTDRAYEIVNRVVGQGEATEVAENGAYPQKEIKQDIAITIQPKKFGFITDVSRELIEDNLFTSIQDSVAKGMRNSMDQTHERRGLNLLNNGFTTQLAEDGLSLFNTVHVLVNGGTQSNRASVATALDIDSLWTGRNTMKTTKGNSGLFDNIYDAKFIVVPQALERRANELIKSEWVPQSMENQANVIGSLTNMTVLTSPLLTSDTAWFLVANPSEVLSFALVNYQRKMMNITSLFNVTGSVELGNAVDKDVFSWKTSERFEVATPTWFGVYGNAGA